MDSPGGGFRRTSGELRAQGSIVTSGLEAKGPPLAENFPATAAPAPAPPGWLIPADDDTPFRPPAPGDLVSAVWDDEEEAEAGTEPSDTPSAPSSSPSSSSSSASPSPCPPISLEGKEAEEFCLGGPAESIERTSGLPPSAIILCTCSAIPLEREAMPQGGGKTPSPLWAAPSSVCVSFLIDEDEKEAESSEEGTLRGLEILSVRSRCTCSKEKGNSTPASVVPAAAPSAGLPESRQISRIATTAPTWLWLFASSTTRGGLPS
mmetsp:Transcript_29256/g.57432  ORF Transcript_29256/g.57432 Transcript_29256/m.57432 type:complete len:263 (-) Transcript_29256:1725-2513(-)